MSFTHKKIKSNRTSRAINQKAEAGIGSLILFIALVLVAAAAAAVFITTTSNLQGKAISSASGVQKQVADGVMMLEMWGENATQDNGYIGDIYFKIKLQPGSDAIVLNNSIVGVSIDAGHQTYKFNQSSGCSYANLTASAAVGNKFLITPRINYARGGYLQDGDIIDVCVRLPQNISGDSHLSVQFFPPFGAATTLSITTPSVMSDNKIPLYP